MEWSKTTEAKFEDIFEEPVVSFEEIDGGRNNRIFKIQTESGKVFALKYYPSESDTRLNAEFDGIEFLNRMGLAVPRAYKKDAGRHVALFEFVDGVRKDPEDITKEDIDQLVEFIVGINSIKPSDVEQKFNLSAYPIEQLTNYLDGIERRVASFLDYVDSPEAHPSAKELAKDIDVDSLRKMIANEAMEKFGSEYMTAKLPTEQLRLSPVDFGIHNALFDDQGNVTIIDFEYFGWDDPARTIAEFTNHITSNGIDSELIDYFVSECIDKMNPDEAFLERLEACKWLNAREWVSILLDSMTKRKMDQVQSAVLDFDPDDHVKKQIPEIKRRLKKLGYIN